MKAARWSLAVFLCVSEVTASAAPTATPPQSPSPTNQPTVKPTSVFCTSTRCKNGGHCSVGDTSCTCLSGFSGKTCTTTPSPTPAPTQVPTAALPTQAPTTLFCTSTRCKNGGHCSVGDTSCTCLSGFSGKICTTTASPTPVPTQVPTTALPTASPTTLFCTSTRCKNGGHCAVGDVSCTCLSGFSGKTCTTTPSPTPAPTLCSTSSTKKGIAYEDFTDADLQAFANTNVKWFYDWSWHQSSQTSGSYSTHGFSYYPMMWNAVDVNTLGTAGFLQAMPTSSGNILLTFNEPNFVNQANMTPLYAAQQWALVETVAAARGMEIASPATDYCGGACINTDPITWLDTFFARCQDLYASGCKVDYIAMHSYTCQVEWLADRVNMYAKYNKKIMVTEFACGDDATKAQSASAQMDYMKAAVSYLEGDDRIAKYAWFSGRTPYFASSLLGTDRGTLSDLGKAYVCAS